MTSFVSSVIVGQIDVTSLAVFKSKDDSPVGTDCNGPKSLEISFQGVKTKRENVQVFYPFCCIECSKDEANPTDVLGGKFARVVTFVKPLQRSVPEARYQFRV